MCEGKGIENMSLDVYEDWNSDGNLPEIDKCPFCGSRGILCDNGYEKPIIDPETGAYIDMDISDGDIFWIECQKCGIAQTGGYDSPEEAIQEWNKRV